jgi:hypothetical protein
MRFVLASIFAVVVLCAGFAAYFAAYGLYHIVRMVGRMI